MANNAIETVMGALVLSVAGGFLYFAYDNSNVKNIDGYVINAGFTNIAGIGIGSDVRIGGVKVGVVEDVELDAKTYQAQAQLRVQQKVKLPKDSSAAIQSTGLIGNKFIALEPGGEEETLADGDRIQITQSAVNIEELIGKFVFSGGGADKGDGDSAGAPAADENPLSSGLE